jgi:hypothetical protein
MSAFVARALRATRILAGDERIPRPLRGLAALALLPIPGPVDEAVLLALAPLLLVFRRRSMQDAWRDAAGPEPRRLPVPRSGPAS